MDDYGYITTKRLALRALTYEQLASALEALEAAFTPPYAQSSSGARLMAERLLLYRHKRVLMGIYPDERMFCTTWLMELNGDGTAVGELGFKGPPVGGEVEIGYGVEPRYRNRGYMKEAAAALCDYGLSLPGVTSIAAYTGSENYASQNVLAACGFEFLSKYGKMIKFRLRP